MPLSYTGRCACGSVTLVIAGEPIGVGQCWCRQCQQIGAGGGTNNALFLTDQVTITGELTSHSYTAASGNQVTQWFCGQCGAPVWGQSAARSQICAVKLGVIDEPHGLRPQVAIWMSEAPPWAHIDPALPQFPGMPPAPPALVA